MNNIELSIIIPVLNSHEIVRRQILHYTKMDLSSSIEILFIDDGSIPPLKPNIKLNNLYIYPTNDFRPWTQPLAKNYGATLANGKRFLFTDIDHILSKDLLNIVLNCKDDVIRFKRRIGVLDENGNFTQDLEILKQYGLTEDRYKQRGLYYRPHSNSVALKKEIFESFGGYRESKILQYPTHDDVWIRQRVNLLWKMGKATIAKEAPTIYMFPAGACCHNNDPDPLNLFHNLNRHE